MILLTNDVWVYGIWFASIQKGDWMVALYRTSHEDKDWTFIYQLRYYKDDKGFDSDDKKSWYTVEMKDKTLKQIQENINIILDICSVELAIDIDFISLKCLGGDKKVMKALAKHKCLHIKEETFY